MIKNNIETLKIDTSKTTTNAIDGATIRASTQIWNAAAYRPSIRNSLGFIVMVINALTPNFMAPITADGTTGSSSGLCREGSSGLLLDEVGCPTSCGCGRQHGEYRR